MLTQSSPSPAARGSVAVRAGRCRADPCQVIYKHLLIVPCRVFCCIPSRVKRGAPLIPSPGQTASSWRMSSDWEQIFKVKLQKVLHNHATVLLSNVLAPAACHAMHCQPRKSRRSPRLRRTGRGSLAHNYEVIWLSDFYEHLDHFSTFLPLIEGT